jgi:hypothetical protein
MAKSMEAHGEYARLSGSVGFLASIQQKAKTLLYHGDIKQDKATVKKVQSNFAQN